MRLSFIVLCMVALRVSAAPFLTPEMMKRNGLTDEQYEKLWSMGKKPQIDVGAARQWMYRSSRYGNVMEWLEAIGKTNNFAALAARVPALTERNDELAEANRLLSVSRDEWRTLAESWYVAATNRQSRTDAVIEWAREQQEKAKLQTTKAIWQSFIDRLCQ